MILKKVTELTLRSGEKLFVTEAEGASARQAKASAQNKSIIFPSIKNRMIDASFIVDIKDRSIEDRDATAREQNEQHKGALIAAGLLQPEDNTKYQPGYIKYVVAGVKLRKKFGGNVKQIRDRLDSKQIELVTQLLADEGLGW